MARAHFDAVLVAGRYTLLDQSMLRLVPVAAEAATRLIVGGVFNSGILATGAVEGATFHYDPAPPDVLEQGPRHPGDLRGARRTAARGGPAVPAGTPCRDHAPARRA